MVSSAPQKNTTTLQTNVFVTEILRLLVTNKERSALPYTENNCQDQLHSPQSVSVSRSILQIRTCVISVTGEPGNNFSYPRESQTVDIYRS